MLFARLRPLLYILVPLYVLSLSACSGTSKEIITPRTDAPALHADVNDPYEAFNRDMFAVHMFLDRYALKPAAKTYLKLPETVRTVTGNFFRNLFAPVSVANQTFQGKFENAGVTLSRFAINSTIGIFGLFDVARYVNLAAPEPEDFGQTLALAGVPAGPYLFIPLLGPSSPRDASGRIVDIFLSPTAYSDMHLDAEIGLYLGDAINLRAEADSTLDSIEATALDLYVSYRNLYRQKRARDISGERTNVDELPDLDYLDE